MRLDAFANGEYMFMVKKRLNRLHASRRVSRRFVLRKGTEMDGERSDGKVAKREKMTEVGALDKGMG